VGVRCAFAGGFRGQDTGEVEVDRIGDRWRRGAQVLECWRMDGCKAASGCNTIPYLCNDGR
jgi:hypothetical protein